MADNRIHIEKETDELTGQQVYYAELWVRPFSGFLLAQTRKVPRRSQAVRDANRIFGPFLKGGK